MSIGGHIFEVKDKGGRGFAYIIEDNAFKISLNKSNSNNMPMAYAKISSEYLTLCGVNTAVADLHMVISELGGLYSDPFISRVDLCADFSTGYDFEQLRSTDFVTKCVDFATFERKPEMTGMTVGMGGDISFRLYNKTTEEKIHPRPYLLDLWQASGWDNVRPVWRGEFQLKREALKGMKIDTVQNLLDALPSLWNYLACDWLRIVAENPSDTHRDRWPSQPFWVTFSQAFGTENIFALSERFKNDRAPNEDKILRRVGSALASFAAVKGYKNLHRALACLLPDADAYFGRISRGNEDFSSHVAQKLAEKCKQYNLAQPSRTDKANEALSGPDF